MGKAAQPELPQEINELTSRIIGAAIEVHKELGPGLLERVYQRAMQRELRRLGVDAKAEVVLPVYYKGELIDEEGFKLDLLVEDSVVVELKSVEALKPVHKRQVLTYARLADKPLGLLINFNTAHVRDGIRRVINPWRNHVRP